MNMTRRQFLAGIVKVAAVISVCQLPGCLPLQDPGEPQPIKVRWTIHGAQHTTLMRDGDTITIDENGKLAKITRINHNTLEIEREAYTWQEWAAMGQIYGQNRAVDDVGV